MPHICLLTFLGRQKNVENLFHAFLQLPYQLGHRLVHLVPMYALAHRVIQQGRGSRGIGSSNVPRHCGYLNFLLVNLKVCSI